MSKPFTLIMFLAVLTVTTLAGASLSTNAQADLAAPPAIIDVLPLPGVELQPNAPLTITFNQPMDQSAVEAAFSLTPQVGGAFSWLDPRTMRFIPETELERATTYTVTLNTQAATANGTPFADPQRFEIRTLGNIRVASVTPDVNATEIAADSQIVIAFDRPVVPLTSTVDLGDLPVPLVFEPAIAGEGEWINTSIYAFTPADGLAGSTTYSVTVAEGLTASDGAVLTEPYTWNFSTLPPEVLNMTPVDEAVDILLEEPIVVNFSQPMERTSTEAAFFLAANGETATGTFEWNDDNTGFEFIPDNRLMLGASYIITLNPTAQSINGGATLTSGISQTFNTVELPRIVNTTPDQGEPDATYMQYNRVRFEFNTVMDNASFEGKISVEPEPETLEVEIPSYDPRIIWVGFEREASTTYTVTLAAGAEDQYGNAIPEDYMLTFTTRPIESEVYPIINNEFMITGTHRDDTTLSVMTTGAGWLNYALYDIAPTDLTVDIGGDYNLGFEFSPYALSGDIPPWAVEGNLVRRGEIDFDTGNETKIRREIPLASAAGGQLEPGLYWVTTDSPFIPAWIGSNTLQFALAVANANLTVKRAPDETFVWVTDMADGTAVANAAVTVYQRGTVLASGTTNADGVFRTDVDLSSEDEHLQIFVEGDGVFGAWYDPDAQSLPTQRGYLYTDRPVYRPGETVYYRGVLRNRRDMDYRVPDVNTVAVSIQHPWDDQQPPLYEGTVELTEFGSFSGEFVLPDNAPIGELVVRANFGDGEAYLSWLGDVGFLWNAPRSSQVTFEVAEFRVPEYEVHVTPQQDSIIQGESVTALVEADFYAGGAVGNAGVSYFVRGEGTGFRYQGQGNYSFFNHAADSFYAELGGNPPYGEQSELGQTNANGEYLLAVDSVTTEEPRPYRIIVEATVTDEAEQPISSRSELIAHPAEVYVGLQTDSYFGEVDTALNVDLITVTPDSTPVSDQTIDIEVIRTQWERTPVPGEFGRYEWTRDETIVETTQVSSGADGTASFTFTPEAAGSHIVRASVTDTDGRLNRGSRRVYVVGGERVFWGAPSQFGNTVDLVVDRDAYAPGDTARVLIPLPYEDDATVLLTVERADVLEYVVLEARGATTVYDLPILSEYAPTIYINMVAVRGISDENPNPDFVTGRLRVDVEPVEQRLTVETTPSNFRNEPRGEVSFDVLVRDYLGNPVQAEVGLALTDEAVLALREPNSTTLERMFYGRQSSYINTNVSLSALMDLLDDAVFPGGRGGGGGGGGDGLPAFIREDFVYTPLWEPDLVTDENGQATVSVTLPDNLTTWKLDARAVTQSTLVGQTEDEIVSTLPLIVRPVAPRFFVVGDRVELAAVVNNNTDETQLVDVTLQADGLLLESPVTQTVTIEGGSRARVEWLAVTEDVSGVDLVFAAQGDGGYEDAARPALRTGEDDLIPVYRYQAPDVVGTGGILREQGAAVEAISLATRLSDVDGELTVRLDRSLAATTIDSLDYLENFPHQCTEQTVSRFLPNIVTFRTLQALNIVDAELEANLTSTMTDSLAQLVSTQNDDGSWGWFPGMDGNGLVTAYAALGLIEARDAGFAIDSAVIDNAVSFVQSDFVVPDTNTRPFQLNRQAFYVYVLARNGIVNRGDYTGLLAQRLEMSYAGRSFLLMATNLAFPGDNELIPPLVSDLTNGAILSANGAHWEENRPDWLNWGSDTRTTALALNALVQTDPTNPLLPNAVRWLMVARRGDHWTTTQETAWSVMALTDWMVVTGELDGNYEYTATFNAQTLADDTVSAQTVRGNDVLRVQVGEMLSDTVNNLTIARGEGPGALYYTAYLDLQLPADEVTALDRGITVSREYYLPDSDTPVTAAALGDAISVRLTVNVPQDVYYFVLEDPLPAGAEAIDTAALTSSQGIADPRLSNPAWEDANFWFWRWWIFDHTELRDERVSLYADFLPRGTYVYSYQVRATLAGEFQTMPATAYAFYQPEVFGRTDGMLFTITGGDETVEVTAR